MRPPGQALGDDAFDRVGRVDDASWRACLEIGGCGFHDQLEYNDYGEFALPIMRGSGQLAPGTIETDDRNSNPGTVGPGESMRGQMRGAGWMSVIPAVILALWLAGASLVVWHGLDALGSRIADRLVSAVTNPGRPVEKPASADTGPVRMSDPRLGALRQAARSWKRSLRSRREVVDQVCLVPDVGTFFEAIAAWDERSFFPILIDEPAWTLPFIRAFRPARVVRHESRSRPAAPAVEAAAEGAADGREAAWSRAAGAVARAWTRPSRSAVALPDAGLPPLELGRLHPASFSRRPRPRCWPAPLRWLAAVFSPWCGCVAAASPAIEQPARSPRRFGDVLSVPEAWTFARRVEWTVAALVPSYDRLGDDCDFLTIAADWPFRYAYDEGNGPVRGLYALDDLIG